MGDACRSSAWRIFRTNRPLGGHSDRSSRSAKDGRTPHRRRNSVTTRLCHREAKKAGRSAQHQSSGRGRARRTRGGEAPQGNHRAHPTRRCRLRVDQGVGDGRTAFAVVVRPERGARCRAPVAPVQTRGEGEEPDLHQSRHGRVQRSRHHDCGVHANLGPNRIRTARGRDRATGLPARCSWRDDAFAEMVCCTPSPWRRGNQDAHRQGRKLADGTSRVGRP